MDIPQARVPAKMAFDSGHQFCRIIRFCHIVIRPHRQAQYFVRIFAFRTQDNNRDILYFPDFHPRRQAVQFWHHHIHNNKLYLLCHHFQRLHPVIRLQNLIPFFFQQQRNRPDNLPVIVHYQYAFFHNKFLSPLKLAFIL